MNAFVKIELYIFVMWLKIDFFQLFNEILFYFRIRIGKKTGGGRKGGRGKNSGKVGMERRREGGRYGGREVGREERGNGERE